MKKLILIIVLFLSIQNLSAKDVDVKNDVGLSATYQSQQMDISLPFFVSPTTTLIPSLGLTYVEDFSSSILLGIAIKSYSGTKAVRTFWSPHVGVFISSPNEGESVFDLMFGLGLGAEYFISDNFSVGIEAQLNGVKSDEFSNRFGNPGGITANTASVIYATIWF